MTLFHSRGLRSSTTSDKWTLLQGELCDPENGGGPGQAPNKADPKIQAERQRIAEDIARALREAGLKCSDEPDQPKLRRDN